MYKKIISFVIVLTFQFSFSQNILISQGGTLTVNGGEVFYDAGGAIGNDGNTNYTITLCPSVAGQRVAINFSYFNTYYYEVGGTVIKDMLNIHNGNSIASSNIGSLTGDYSQRFSNATNPFNVGSRAPFSAGNPVYPANQIPDIYAPNLFTSTSPDGCITLSFINSSSVQSPGWVANISLYKPADVLGCSIDITPTIPTICSGQATTLNVNGAITTYPINNNFNNATIGDGWSATSSASFQSNVCGSNSIDNTTFLWMQNAPGPRRLETNNFNLINGGTISFEYRQASTNAQPSPCEASDYNTTFTSLEGIYLQYSTDNGTTWQLIKYIFPSADNISSMNGCGNYVHNWTRMEYPIPDGAKTLNTRLRWIQIVATNSSTDNWGLDNVAISTTLNSNITVTNLNTGAIIANSTSNSLSVNVNPTVTTTYRATISNGVTSCFEDTTITVNSGTNTTISYTGNPFLNNAAPVNVSITNGPVTGNYTATPSGLTLNPTTGQITPSSSLPGNYTVSVPTSCGNATTTVQIYSQENCFNGIDDNGNGLIDLNDPECNCNPPSITSIIPNPSFETYSSLPTGFSQLNLATPWVQASTPTTDYLNTLGFVFPGMLNLGLLPFPNGNGAVGCFFVNNWKEYIGTSLLNTIILGTNYQLKINIAACSYDNNLQIMENINVIPNLEPVNITIYGNTGTGNFPLNTTGDPSSFDPNWIILGQTLYNPISNWNELIINFTSSVNINKIMIGAPVVLPNSYPTQNISIKRSYFLFDNLRLNTTLSFGAIIDTSGNFCNNNLILTASPNYSNLNYQWYLNGVAIAGATNATLNVPFSTNNIGEYKVRIYNSDECSISEGIHINDNLITPTFTPIAPICAGGTLSALPTTSTNGISGTWSPALNNSVTTTYTFTPNTGQCATIQTITITVNPIITPTFTPIAPICVGGNLLVLPTTSTNGISGTWAPALNNSATTTYTFTPSAGQCAISQTLTIVVNNIPIVTLNNAIKCKETPFEIVANVDVPANYNYVWTVPNGVVNPGNVPSFFTNSTGSYSVEITNTTTLCKSAMATANISDYELNVNLISNNNVQCLNRPIEIKYQLTNDANGAEVQGLTNDFSYSLNNNIVTISGSSNQIGTINYTIIPNRNLNCFGNPTNGIITIKKCQIQNGISPDDGNGENDFFDLSSFEVSYMAIFNRYGMKVYDYHNYKKEWNGQDKYGNLLPTATYYYYLEFKDNTATTGWIYLMRAE